jgi:threonylcarbamoyladenosine tRNA methylthiotransferase MtaB
MPGLDILTFGCRLNAYESEVMRGLAGAAGLVDAVIVNTCAVTAEAERQARQAIRRARRERPGARIVVTGCAAQIDPARFAAMPEVDQVIGNAEKLTVEGFAPAAAARIAVGDIGEVRETVHHLVDGFEGKARAVVQVQQGCDHRCTFCVIPLGRGPSRSVPVGAVARQVRALVEAGYPEIVLSGVDITAYGADLPGRPTLGQMIRRVLAQVPEARRLRLSSLDPVEIDDDLWRLIAEEPRLMPHLHLSLQSGDDLVLKRMKRRHGRTDALAVASRARGLRPEMALGADLIAGFPTETEAMFENTRTLVEEAGLAYLHVFPYSERPGTPAARMPAVPKPVRKARAERLRQAGAAALRRHLDRRVGGVVRAVVESEISARAEDFSPIAIDGGVPGSVVSLAIVARDGDRLRGRPIS